MGIHGDKIAFPFASLEYKLEDDLYVAECPEVGTASQGPTIEEAISNLKEATELYLEEFPKPMMDRAIMTTFEAQYAVCVSERNSPA
jgi:predicted RNase H-like HicB family nuclease